MPAVAPEQTRLGCLFLLLKTCMFVDVAATALLEGAVKSSVKHLRTVIPRYLDALHIMTR